MTYLKLYGKRFLYTILSLFISLSLLTLLYYFDIIGENLFNILKVIILLFNIFISNYILGKKAQNKGFLEGIKFGSIIIITLFLLTILTSSAIRIRLILYYIIIMITSIFGGIVGISKKKET